MKRILMFIAMLLVLAAQAKAQEAEVQIKLPSEKDMDKVQAMLTDQMKEIYWDNALGFDGKKLIPPSENEKDIYEIPADEETKVIVSGMEAYRFQWCGLDSEAYFKATMQQRKTSGKWNVYQMSYISLLQSSAGGFAEVTLKGKQCDADTKKAVEKEYAKAMEELEHERSNSKKD